MTLDSGSLDGVKVAILAATVSTVGLASVVFIGDWGRRHSPNFSAFAVGFLLVAIFFHLIPESFSLAGQQAGGNPWDAAFWIGGGAFVVAFISLTFGQMSRKRVNGRDVAIGYASILALAAHSFIDGLAYETTFRQDPVTGFLATFGLLLHEIPEAVIAYFLVRDTGMPKYIAALWAFLAASVTTVIGAVLIAFVWPGTNLDMAAMIGLAAGGLLYITIFHLGWHARLAAKGQGYFYASIGVAISLAAVILTEIFGNRGH
ncbi:MAG: ZIP family metal transporter [Parvularculaceae bacterium]